MPRFDEVIAENITAMLGLRGGFGNSVIDPTAVASPAGASVELKRFVQGSPVAVNGGFRIVGSGTVANNANAKSIVLGVNSLNPAGQPVITPAINTANAWLFDVMFINLGAGLAWEWGMAYTGPSSGVVTQQMIVNLNRALTLTAVGNFFVFIAQQVAAGDITFTNLYVSPIISPA
jgi:hypothetical protein